jgi:hypothetical protein
MNVLAIMTFAARDAEARGELRDSLDLRKAHDAVTELITAARKLEARGFFAHSSCADVATAADMRSMRIALAKVQP